MIFEFIIKTKSKYTIQQSLLFLIKRCIQFLINNSLPNYFNIKKMQNYLAKECCFIEFW